MESANVNFDEHVDVQVDESKQSEDYKSFVYFYEGMTTEDNVANQVGNQQQIITSFIQGFIKNEGFITLIPFLLVKLQRFNPAIHFHSAI